jgi:4-hydroxy-2-oxovalerate aldolase
MTHPVRLVETTLRDGSYEIDFQFTAADTALLGAELDRAGFTYIELCHGNGIGCDLWKSPSGKYRAAATDEEHLAAAQSVIRRAAYGVLMVAGSEFAPPDYMKILPRYGAKFVRLALRPEHLFEKFVDDYVDHARSLGLLVSINLMQTPAVPVGKVAEGAARLQKRGVEWFYVVDSAGSLTPDKTQEYVRAVRDASGLVVGMHAHNNGALALANSLAAVAAGAELVDATLQGVGRATGNASTEQTMLALQRLGHEKALDREAIYRLGETARSLFAERGNDPTCFVSGAAGIHSRALPGLFKLAEQRARSPREFVLRVGDEAEKRQCLVRDLFAQDLLDRVVEATPPSAPAPPVSAASELVARQIMRTSENDVAALCEDVFVRSIKRRKQGVVHFVMADDLFFPSALPWETGDLVGVTIPCAAPVTAELPRDRFVDVLVVDDRVPASTVEKLPPPRHRFTFSFRALVADATVDLALLDGLPPWVPAAETPLLQLVVARLGERNIQAKEEPSGGPRVIVASARNQAWAERVRRDDVVVLVDGGDKARALADTLRGRGARVVRPLLAEAIGGRVRSLIQLRARSHSAEAADGTFVDAFVAPGSSNVVVDDLGLPSQVLDRGALPLPQVAPEVAASRVRALVAGRGKL